MVNENASLIKYEPPKCDECGRKIVVLSDLCAKCAAGIELNAPSARPNGEQAEPLALRPLKEQDKAAFEDFWSRLPGVENGFEKSLAEVSWQGCLAYLNKQAEPVAASGEDLSVYRKIADNYNREAPAVAQEPVAFCVEFGGTHLGMPVMNRRDAEALAALIPSRRKVVDLFREAPAVAVNEQMLNALKMVMDDPESLEGRPRTFECVVEAIAAAEAVKGGV